VIKANQRRRVDAFTSVSGAKKENRLHLGGEFGTSGGKKGRDSRALNELLYRLTPKRALELGKRETSPEGESFYL